MKHAKSYPLFAPIIARQVRIIMLITIICIA